MANKPHQLTWRREGKKYWLRDEDGGEDITDIRELELKLVEMGRRSRPREDIQTKAKSLGCDYYLISSLSMITSSEIINYFAKKQS